MKYFWIFKEETEEYVVWEDTIASKREAEIGSRKLAYVSKGIIDLYGVFIANINIRNGLFLRNNMNLFKHKQIKKKKRFKIEQP